MNEKKLPVITPNLKAIEWEEADKWGKELEARFPNQETEDFAQAILNNEMPDKLHDKPLTFLECLRPGERDGEEWIWLAVFKTGDDDYDHERFIVFGSCDYTGWNCQSGMEWFHRASYVMANGKSNDY